MKSPCLLPRRHWMQDERIFHLWSNGRTGGSWWILVDQ
jgi:hypothetical protein